MKIFRFGLILGAIMLAGLSTTEIAAKEPELTLEDVIFNPKYVGGFFGPNTLVQIEGDHAPVLAALGRTDFGTKTRFVKLPDQAKPTKAKYETPPRLPEGRKWHTLDIKASFLIFVSSEGKVESLYCYEQDDRLFALAMAMAIVKWRFNPATIGDAKMPVLYARTLLSKDFADPMLHDYSDYQSKRGSGPKPPEPNSAP